ncbi:MAG TPA: hypothetical protein VK619_09235 [Pyrinomonadaceae bacterium]|jgi:hypothetical protein|nr:hypothetical protein [Pyrinomonadaceae bacterium]
MTEQELSAPLLMLANRLRRDPLYMAYVLATYQAQENLTDEALAHELGTLPLMVVRLSLCKRPDALSSDFAEQVCEIADYTLVDEAKLAHILRRIDALEKLAGRPEALIEPGGETEASHPLAGLLAAARDRYEDVDAEEKPEDEEESEE